MMAEIEAGATASGESIFFHQKTKLTDPLQLHM